MRSWLIDPRLYLVSKDKFLNRARRCADFVQIFIGPGIWVLNHVLAVFRSCRCLVIKQVLEIFFWREVSCIVIFPYTGFHRLFLYMDVTNTRLFVSATLSDSQTSFQQGKAVVLLSNYDLNLLALSE